MQYHVIFNNPYAHNLFVKLKVKLYAVIFDTYKKMKHNIKLPSKKHNEHL